MNVLSHYGYEGAMLPFLAVMTVFLFLRHATSAEVNRRFRFLALSTFVATLLSVMTAFFAGRMAPLSYFMLTTLFYAAANYNAYLLLSYVAEYVDYHSERAKRVFFAILCLGFLLLLINLLTGFAFRVDAAGAIVKGRYYTLVRSVCIFIFVGSAFALQNLYQQFYDNAQFILMNFLLFLLIDAFVLQYLFIDSIQVVYVIATAILFSTFFYLEAPTMRGIAETQQKLNEVVQQTENSTAKTKAASRAKSEFLANTSHEIRTPMNAILGMNDMILKEAEDAESLDAAHHIKRASENLLTIINNILDISRFDSGRMELYPSDFFLSESINDIDALFRERIEEKGLSFVVEVNKELPEHLYGDAEALSRVASNLLDNAIKYTEEGTITLHVLGGGALQKGDEEYREDYARFDQMHLQIMVEDTGIGMHTAEMDRLFEAFERLNLKETQSIQGAGLGLTLVQHMVTLMNGRIRAESVYGEGSVFTVDVPVGIVTEGFTGTIAEYEAQMTEDRAKGEEVSFEGLRALVVDDTPVNLIVAEDLLGEMGFTVETAGSGEACLEKLQAAPFDVVFLDHHMPGMDGVETLARYREVQGAGSSDRGSGTLSGSSAADAVTSTKPDSVPDPLSDGATPKFIALTASTGGQLREEYIRLGFDDYLSKPMTKADVRKVMSQHHILQFPVQESAQVLKHDLCT